MQLEGAGQGRIQQSGITESGASPILREEHIVNSEAYLAVDPSRFFHRMAIWPVPSRYCGNGG
jgi:hypothetical protein